MTARIQRRRTAGWRKPEGAVCIGRPGKWGNPFVVGPTMTAVEAVEAYRAWLTPAYVEMARAELAGRDLACWCPVGSPCHGDVLVRLVDGLTT